MTFSQKIIYECIKKYIEENYEAPSIREICELAGLSSPATVHKHLKNLKEKGYIDIEPRVKKGIRIKED
jgi:repressor LexA